MLPDDKHDHLHVEYLCRAYGNEVILLMKYGALISMITVSDLMAQTRTVVSRNIDLTIHLYVAIYYLILAGLITRLISRVEVRFVHNSQRKLCRDLGHDQ